MRIRLVLIGATTLSLSACAWLPWWSHSRTMQRAPAAPASSASTPVAPSPPMSSAPAAVPQAVRPRAQPKPTTVEPATLTPAKPGPSKPPKAAEAATRPAPGKSAPPATAMSESSKPSTPAPTASRTASLHGRVQLVAGGGQQLHPGEAVDTVVYFVPAGGAPAPQPREANIITHHRDFRPTAIAIPLGSTLSYVNQDDVRHNVFSVTPGASFNLGYQAGGKRADHVFNKSGLVLVSCNVHHTMEMDVLVVPSPYISKVAADGSFALRGLPAGAGELFVWNPRARLLHRAVSVPTDKAVPLQLIAERPRVVTEIDVGKQP